MFASNLALNGYHIKVNQIYSTQGMYPMSFNGLGLSTEIQQALLDKGYKQPSLIQSKAIPAVLRQQDVIAVANTGTGKTAAFTLPLIHLLATSTSCKVKRARALIITPTRELAAQVNESVQGYCCYTDIQSTAVFGGVRIEPQILSFQKGVDILVATPGRLIDLYHQQVIDFEQLEILVLDEADRMLDLGFAEEINQIKKLLPNERQTLLFSATFSKPVKLLADDWLNQPFVIEQDTTNCSDKLVKQLLHPVDKARKTDLLIYLIKRYKWSQVLVFTRTKHGADKLAAQLSSAGINADSIHGNRTQHARTLVLEGVKKGSIKVLVATDVAARGIDIHQLPCVINLDLPYVPEDYVHRIGRTGRIGHAGVAISFYSEDESKQLRAIERLTGQKIKREIISQFRPIPKAAEGLPEEDVYGNFEPDSSFDARGKGKSHGRKKRRRR